MQEMLLSTYLYADLNNPYQQSKYECNIPNIFVNVVKLINLKCL